jgi:hypothetical protein
MPKTIGSAILSLILLFSLVPALYAQGPMVTSADVELFINLANTQGAAGKNQLMRDSGRDVQSMAVTQGKIGILASVFYGNTPEAQIKANMAQWGISPAEYDIIDKRRTEVVNAFRKSQNLR